MYKNKPNNYDYYETLLKVKSPSASIRTKLAVFSYPRFLDNRNRLNSSIRLASFSKKWTVYSSEPLIVNGATSEEKMNNLLDGEPEFTNFINNVSSN